jgi:hypothetical protein
LWFNSKKNLPFCRYVIFSLAVVEILIKIHVFSHIISVNIATHIIKFIQLAVWCGQHRRRTYICRLFLVGVVLMVMEAIGFGIAVMVCRL